MNRVGVFAGVFDPIHLGHTSFMARVIQEKDLDKIYVLIEEEPKYKTCLAAYSDRKKMVELAVAELPKVEILKPKNKFFPISHTLPAIKKQNPAAKLFLLMGSDVATHLNEWEESKELLKGVELVIADRTKSLPASSLKIREKLKNGLENVELDEAVLAYCKACELYSVKGE